MEKIQKTLVVLKPDTVQRGIIGEIITRFEKVGLKIIGMKMIQPDKEHYHHHYENIGKMITRRGEETFNVTLNMMMGGPVIAIVLEGVEAVELVRKMVGTTEPKSAPPGTIRGDYAHMSFSHADSLEKGVPNIVHASGDLDEANVEIAHWFAETELYKYDSVHDKHVL
jgi:nucleoside-diphosphate kinase